MHFQAIVDSDIFLPLKMKVKFLLLMYTFLFGFSGGSVLKNLSASSKGSNVVDADFKVDEDK